MDQEYISYRLGDGSAVKIEYYASLPSTAQLAREYAKRGYPDRYVVMTEKQTDASITKSRLSAGEYDTALLRASAKGTAAYTADEEVLSDCLPAFFEGGAHRLHRPPHILRHDRPFGAAEGVLLAKRYDSPFARQVIDDFCLVRPQYPAVERICEDLTNTAFAE